MSKGQGVMGSIKAAVKADSLSLIEFEVGMFGWMAIADYLLFIRSKATLPIGGWLKKVLKRKCSNSFISPMHHESENFGYLQIPN